jgi:hypothetical protein
MKTNSKNFGLWTQFWTMACNQTNILVCWKPIKTSNFGQSDPKKQNRAAGRWKKNISQV